MFAIDSMEKIPQNSKNESLGHTEAYTGRFPEKGDVARELRKDPQEAANTEFHRLEQQISIRNRNNELREAEIVTALGEFRKENPGQVSFDPAIASYLQEKGVSRILAIYRHMSCDMRLKLKKALTTGNLDRVVHCIESNEVEIRESMAKMHGLRESDDEFVRTEDRAGWAFVERVNRIAAAHQRRASAWKSAGRGRDSKHLSDEEQDSQEIQAAIARLPLDQRELYEKLGPKMRRVIVSDEALLHDSPEELYRRFKLALEYFESTYGVPLQ